MDTLFKAIVEYEKVPNKMKLSSITPVHKPNKPKDEITSYRPVYVSKNFIKVFEALIFNNLNSFIVSNYVIPDSQYGFRTVMSTVHFKIVSHLIS
jgi:hypothetical protein